MNANYPGGTGIMRGDGRLFVLEGGIASILRVLTSKFATEHLSTPKNPQAAVAALLVEAALRDDNFSTEERACIERLLTERFGMSWTEMREMLAAAEKANAETHLLYGYITLMITDADERLRVALIEMLWEVAHVDGDTHAIEVSLVEKISILLRVSHSECAAARVRSALRQRKQIDYISQPMP